MDKSHSYSKLVVMGFAFLLLLPILSNIGFSTETHQDDDDGWWTDTFQDETYVDLDSNCVISKGSITLNPNTNTQQIYNFSDWETSDDKAYYYTTTFFRSFLPLPPYINILLGNEKEFSRYWDDYDLFAKKDEKMVTTEPSGKSTVHHFRFKIIQDVSFITQLDFYWCGETENSRKISMYYWQPIGNSSVGMWEKAGTSENETVELLGSYTGDLPFDKDNYIDVCIVATPSGIGECSLSSDYVNITAHTQGYPLTGGTATSETISPNSISMWEMLTWNDDTERDTEIKYQILYENNTIIENSILGGNQEGFTDPPVYLNSIPADEYTKIKIRADLETKDPSVTPEILRWSVTWQTKENTWVDLFNSTLRIDAGMSNKVNIEGGNVELIPLINNWTMFGQNPANTRASDGSGPRSEPKPYWLSPEEYKVGSGHRNPVIKDGILYIASSDGSTIYAFNTIFSGDGLYNNPYQDKQGTISNYAVRNSPAITDNLVVVATGNTSDGGVENQVYAFNKNDLKEEWGFTYKDEKTGKSEICYYASPVVSGNKIFLSSWSGDESLLGSLMGFLNLTKGNNKIIALELSDDGINLKKMVWDYSLPAGSFSSPAIYGDNVVVGCANVKPNQDSLFCLDANGKYEWSVNVGSIGMASPVIYDDKVFVVVKKPVTSFITARAEVVAVRLDNGSKLWNYSISEPMFDIYDLDFAACTPAVHEDILFVASPDGAVYAFNVDDGSLVDGWPVRVYTKGIFSSKLMTSSPAYADDRIYIGTPSKSIYAIDVSNGKVAWSVQTKENPSSAAIFSSPIVVDGLLFFTDENEMLYCLGSPPGEQQIEGILVSTPIHLPENHSWDRFHAYCTTESGGNIVFSILDEAGNELIGNKGKDFSLYNLGIDIPDVIRLCADFTAYGADDSILHDWSVTTTPGVPDTGPVFYEGSFNVADTPPIICRIDVKDEKGLWNTSAGYELKYKNQSIIETYEGTAQCPCDNGSTNKITLEVNISDLDILKDNISRLELSENITLLSIRFNIKNSAGNTSYSDWHEFEPSPDKDTEKPIFYNEGFTPKDGWITTNTPTCTIDAKDIGTGSNITGLNINSAKYTLEYKIENQSGIKTKTDTAQCSGSNGSKNIETLSIDISKLDFSENITEIIRIRFYIEDLAENPNSNYSKWYEFKTDAEKPYSYIDNTEDIPYEINTTPVEITATAKDNISGLDHVTLYYRALADSDWTPFASDDKSPYSWSFSVASGEYELCTIATDYAGNEEDYPADGDVSFIFDPNPPDPPSFDDEYRFDELPEFSIEFTDDYKLKSVEYRLNFNEINEWTKINDGDINSKNYVGNWNLTQDDWDYIIEEESYYMYFRLIDSLRNQYITPSASEAVKIIKDFDINETTPHDPDVSDFQEWHWDNVFTISVNVNDEDKVTSLQLQYSHSADNKTWAEWKQYGDNITTSPFEWNFIAKEGSGYYKFKTVVWGTSGNATTSQVKYVGVTLFPTIPIIIMIPLAVILILVTALALGFKPFSLKKRKT